MQHKEYAPGWNDGPWKRFTFSSKDQPVDTFDAQEAVRRWAKRRPFPIHVNQVTSYRVEVDLKAPSNEQHNRAVDSLCRILERLQDRFPEP